MNVGQQADVLRKKANGNKSLAFHDKLYDHDGLADLDGQCHDTCIMVAICSRLAVYLNKQGKRMDSTISYQ